MGDPAKTSAIFDLNTDIIFLQETLAAKAEAIAKFREKWPGESFWSPALGKQGGVAILLSKNFQSSVSQWKKDTSGRILSILLRLGEQRYNFLNIYAPTNPRERKEFFNSLHEYMFPHSIKVIGGDFNSFESELDKFGGNVNTSTDLKEFRTRFQLVDVWRRTHGRAKQCTWFNASKTIGSRLDKFFITQALVTHATKCEILPCVFSDHDYVSLHLDLQNIPTHGPGIWRFNSSLLDDETYCSQVTDILERHILLRETFSSLHEWWDSLKDIVKIATQVYCKSKTRSMNYQLASLTNRLIHAKQSLIEGNTSAPQLIAQLESEIQHLHRTRYEGVKTRSRAQWIEEGEKPTHFFFNLETARAQKNCISSLLDSNDTEVSQQRDLERVNHEFYRRLYSKSAVDDVMTILRRINKALHI